jgi:hypothetical protein
MSGEVFAEPVETTLPLAAPRADPTLGCPQRLRLKPARAHTPDLFRPDQTTGLQNVKMLDHRRQRHPKRPGQFAHRGRSPAQSLHHAPTGRIGESMEHAIKRDGLVKHMLNHSAAPQRMRDTFSSSSPSANSARFPGGRWGTSRRGGNRHAPFLSTAAAPSPHSPHHRRTSGRPHRLRLRACAAMTTRAAALVCDRPQLKRAMSGRTLTPRQPQGNNRMMRLPAVHHAILLGSLLLVAACSCGTGTNVQTLNTRLQARLSPQLATNQATVQQLPDGSQVVLVDQSLFAAGGAQLNDGGRYVLASVIEGLLEPRLLRIEVADTPGTSPYLQNARAQAVTQYFVDYGLAPTLQPPAAQPVVPVGVPPQGTTITVHLASN